MSATRSTPPSGPAPSSVEVATQLGAASSRTRAVWGVRPAESTTTRSGCSRREPPVLVAHGQVRVIGEDRADTGDDRVALRPQPVRVARATPALEIQRLVPSAAATRPSSVVATFHTTKGRCRRTTVSHRSLATSASSARTPALDADPGRAQPCRTAAGGRGVGDGVDDPGDARRRQRLGARTGAAGVGTGLERDDDRAAAGPVARRRRGQRPRRADRRPARAGPRRPPRPRRPARQRPRSGWGGWPHRPRRTARPRGASPQSRSRSATGRSLSFGRDPGAPGSGVGRVADESAGPRALRTSADPACCLPSGLSPSVPEFHRVNRSGSGAVAPSDPGRGLSPPARNFTDPGARCSLLPDQSATGGRPTESGGTHPGGRAPGSGV